MPGHIISSDPIAAHIVWNPLFLMNCNCLSWELHWGIVSEHSVFMRQHFTTMASKWYIPKFSHWACPAAPLIKIDCHLHPGDRTYICRDTFIMHEILLYSKTSDCNKDEYQKTKYHEFINEPLLWKYGTKSPAVLRRGLSSSGSLMQYCSAIFTAVEDSHRAPQESQKL